MSSPPQPQAPRIRVIVDDSSDFSFSNYPGPSEPGESIPPAHVTEGKSDPDPSPEDIDRLIPLFDSEEYQGCRVEIQKLALRIENLEKKDKKLTESLGM